MKTIGAYEAKTYLPRLLREVAEGQSFAITKHGVPVAFLTSATGGTLRDSGTAIDAWREYRAERRLELGPDVSLQDLIQEGRRF